MKILLIGNDFHSIYFTRKELLIELLKCHQVFVAIPYDDRNVLLKNLGCEIILLSMKRSSKNPFSELAVLHNIKIVLKKIRPDKIFTFTIKPNIYTGILQKRGKECQIATITGMGRIFQKETIIKKIIIVLYRFAFRNIQTVFFENTESEQIFSNLKIAKEKHIVVNGAGVNLEENTYEKYPNDQQGIYLVFVGRIERDKGIFELLETADYFEKRNIPIKFIVLGNCEKSFEKEFFKIRIPSNVLWKGWQMDVHHYLRDAHGIILPSYHEGMANVLLEAAAAGRPILASRIHGCMESFDEGISGLGFERKNAKDMIRAINIFLGLSNDVRRKMGQMGRKKMEQEFDRKKVVQIFIEQLKV